MDSENALINVGDLAKPATVLIEKISGAIGTLYLPHHIRKVARAEADAATIRALAGVEINDIQHRALVRMIQGEVKKQENIEAISSGAIEGLNPSTKPEDIDNDWLSNFFDKCKLISNQEMQSLWSRILSGEANKPGTFSKRTVELVSSLEKKDADLFTRLCRFGCMIGQLTPIIFDSEEVIYKSHGITFAELTHLDNLGMIRFESLAGFQLTMNSNRVVISYYGTPIVLELAQRANQKIKVGKVLLSSAGRELAPICGSTRIDEFVEYVVRKWRDDGVIASSPWPRPASV